MNERSPESPVVSPWHDFGIDSTDGTVPNSMLQLADIALASGGSSSSA